ncbi:nuclear transport factor 2 family protein [Streptomyces sp. NPDC050625]|uniref:nuclear transport factor 2 family protein n=1 Tax=Streptomyces sp. NPDC050625 TaxID=3154629 RepID=UPI00341FAFF1
MRSPQETFQNHVRALAAGDLDALAANFAPDAVFISSAGVLRGREGVKQGIGAVLCLSAGRTVAHPCSPATSCSWSGRV